MGMWRGMAAGLFLVLAPLAPTATGQSAPTIAETAEPELWMSDAYFDYLRPKITPRNLTSEEKAEIPKLRAQFLGAYNKDDKAFQSRADYFRDYRETRPFAPGPFSALKRLMELGESGDRDAMLAVRDGLVAGWGTGAVLDAGSSDGSGLALDSLPDEMRLALAGHWTAQVWYRYGPERGVGADISMYACLRTIKNNFKPGWEKFDTEPAPGWARPARTLNADCGFSFLYPVSFRKKSAGPLAWEKAGKRETFPDVGAVVFSWIRKGGKPDFQVTEFRATVGDDAFEQTRFNKLIESLYSLEPNYGGTENSGVAWTPGEAAWAGHFASRTGQTWRVDERIAKIEQSRAEQAVRDAEYAAWMTEIYEAAQERDAQAKAAARLAWEEVLRSGALFSGPLPSAGVTIRSYDQNGNYLGSTVTTTGEADLLGAKPQ